MEPISEIKKIQFLPAIHWIRLKFATARLLRNSFYTKLIWFQHQRYEGSPCRWCHLLKVWKKKWNKYRKVKKIRNKTTDLKWKSYISNSSRAKWFGCVVRQELWCANCNWNFRHNTWDIRAMRWILAATMVAVWLFFGSSYACGCDFSAKLCSHQIEPHNLHHYPHILRHFPILGRYPLDSCLSQ